MNGSIKLSHGRGSVLEPFLNRCFSVSGVKRMVWVSPWLTHISFRTGNTQGLLKKISDNGVYFTIITREPEKDNEEHKTFIKEAASISTCEIFFIPFLHAKYYFCQTNQLGFAIIGSPNLYRWTKRSYEIGVLIDSLGEGEEIIDQLENITDLFRLPQNGNVFKRLE